MTIVVKTARVGGEKLADAHIWSEPTFTPKPQLIPRYTYKVTALEKLMKNRELKLESENCSMDEDLAGYQKMPALKSYIPSQLIAFLLSAYIPFPSTLR